MRGKNLASANDCSRLLEYVFWADEKFLLINGNAASRHLALQLPGRVLE